MLPWGNFENSNSSEAKSYAFWYSVVLYTVNHLQMRMFTFDGSSYIEHITIVSTVKNIVLNSLKK